jgi:hypothetical protein
MSRRERARAVVRITITVFVLILLTVVALGWAWTATHQPAPLRTASHVVLAIAGAAGVFALTRIWRRDAGPSRPGRT